MNVLKNQSSIDETSRRVQLASALMRENENFFNAQYDAANYLMTTGVLSNRSRQEFISSLPWLSATKASSASISSKEIELMVANQIPGELRILARNSMIPEETLTQLSTHFDVNVRFGVASNPATPSATLEKMIIADPEWTVRSIALKNPNTSPELLSAVLADKSLKSFRFEALSNWAIDSREFTSVLNFGTPELDIALNATTNPLNDSFDWALGMCLKTLESDKSSARKKEIAFESLANLASNPGVSESQWKILQKSCPGLLLEWPHLKNRPKL